MTKKAPETRNGLMRGTDYTEGRNWAAPSRVFHASHTHSYIAYIHIFIHYSDYTMYSESSNYIHWYLYYTVHYCIEQYDSTPLHQPILHILKAVQAVQAVQARAMSWSQRPFGAVNTRPDSKEWDGLQGERPSELSIAVRNGFYDEVGYRGETTMQLIFYLASLIIHWAEASLTVTIVLA